MFLCSCWADIFYFFFFFCYFNEHVTTIPVGWVFLSKYWLSNSRACGVNDVRRFRFLLGSLPIKSVRFWTPFLYLSSASAIHLSNTGLIFCALLGVMSSFSNLQKIQHVNITGTDVTCYSTANYRAPEQHATPQKSAWRQQNCSCKSTLKLINLF